MISDEVVKLLSQPWDGDYTEDQGPIMEFTDHNGDSVAIRLFRGGNGRAEEHAKEWIALAKQECMSLCGDLVTKVVTFPQLGGRGDGNNVIAIIGAYDLVSKKDVESIETGPKPYETLTSTDEPERTPRFNVDSQAKALLTAWDLLKKTQVRETYCYCITKDGNIIDVGIHDHHEFRNFNSSDKEAQVIKHVPDLHKASSKDEMIRILRLMDEAIQDDEDQQA